MEITFELKESAFDKFFSFLENVKDEIKIKNEDLYELYLFEKAKKDKTNMKDINEFLKEYKKNYKF